jgi:FkbM family methyltransferase
MIRALIRKSAALMGYEIKRAGAEPTQFIPKLEDYHLDYDGPNSPCNFSFWLYSREADQWYREWFYAAKRPAWELDEFAQLVKHGDRVLEIGCHHGFLTMMLAHLAGPTGYILAVEANPLNTLVAQAQVGLNQLGSRVHVIHGAGAEESGTLRMSWRTNSHVVNSPAPGRTYEAPALTGDELDQRFGPFSVLKVDVEGFEGSVLRGCKAILARKPVLLLELHPNFIESYGYKYKLDEVLEMIGSDQYEGSIVIRPNFELSLPFSNSAVPRNEISNVHLHYRGRGA